MPAPIPLRNPVSELQRLLGDAVFLACPTRTKKPKGKWGCQTLADMTPDYLAKLRNGNIGVALGAVSGGLCAIDLDQDELIEPFLAANPALADTFSTPWCPWPRVLDPLPSVSSQNGRTQNTSRRERWRIPQLWKTQHGVGRAS